MRSRVALVILLLLAGVGAVFLLQEGPEAPISASLLADDGPLDSTGFARATDPTGLTFPDAFGAHPDYQTEWWYYTGNIQSVDGRPFGYIPDGPDACLYSVGENGIDEHGSRAGRTPRTPLTRWDTVDAVFKLNPSTGATP